MSNDNSHFFAYLSRMRHIKRWGLMKNVSVEDIEQHSFQVSMIAHGLAVIGNKHFNKNYDTDRTCTLGLFHEVSEVITGDLATPIKYFNPEINTAYKKIEAIATKKLLNMLPTDLLPDYEPLLDRDESSGEWKLVKAADKICAYIKCVEELKAGNKEFLKATETIKNAINDMDMEEVSYFMTVFMPSFELTLDELN